MSTLRRTSIDDIKKDGKGEIIQPKIKRERISYPKKVKEKLRKHKMNEFKVLSFLRKSINTKNKIFY